MIKVEISSLGKSSFTDVSEFILFLWDSNTLNQFINLTEKSIVELQKNHESENLLQKIFEKLCFIKTLQCFMNMMRPTK